MATVLIHATVSLDGFMADPDGGVDWMFGFPSADEDQRLVQDIMSGIGAVVGGADREQTIVEGELPYGGILGVPVFLMTHTPHDPVVRDGTEYSFVVDDIGAAVAAAALAAGERTVSLLGGSIARQALTLGLVDEIQLHVVPVLLGEGISLFGGLGRRVTLERIDTAAYASETHLRYRVLR
ncbi:dihydrofolate reductase family protein [Herbiconiux sp. L3-i23]|uniref:dihydrofolate reductase family protein n=1 Tax=Herbiconiux sp. L3-i23 TaxID=2905871 RepID=UPI00204F81D4|nr:dihydrofolate reductase family protein [Herbiconiux sp. L3-i23]BDI22661.1 deaminase reductase [Herbiconiux sp. L3-i23]